MSSESKRCSRCKHCLPLSSFHNRSDTKDGKKTQCIDCVNTQRREARLEKRLALQFPKELEYHTLDTIEARCSDSKQQQEQQQVNPLRWQEIRHLPWKEVQKLIPVLSREERDKRLFEITDAAFARADRHHYVKRIVPEEY